MHFLLTIHYSTCISQKSKVLPLKKYSLCNFMKKDRKCLLTSLANDLQVCIVTQTFTQSLVEKFQLGCVDKSVSLFSLNIYSKYMNSNFYQRLICNITVAVSFLRLLKWQINTLNSGKNLLDSCSTDTHDTYRFARFCMVAFNPKGRFRLTEVAVITTTAINTTRM